MANQNVIRAHLTDRYKEETYTMTPLSTSEFGRLYPTSSFNIDNYATEFQRHCVDYGYNSYTLEQKTLTASFVSKMIYTVGPSAMQVLKQGGDKTYTFGFPKSNNLNSLVYVSPHKVINNYETDFNENYMCLSMRMATLLAVRALNTINNTLVDAQIDPALTPLCGAVFSKDSLDDICREFSLTHKAALAIMNSSSASGGQYLADSTASCAAVCAIKTTRSVKDKNAGNEMVMKVIKQYCNYGKTLNIGEIRRWAKFATGGSPGGIGIDEIMTLYDASHTDRDFTIRERVAIHRAQVVGTARDTLVADSVAGPPTRSSAGGKDLQGAQLAKDFAARLTLPSTSSDAKQDFH